MLKKKKLFLAVVPLMGFERFSCMVMLTNGIENEQINRRSLDDIHGR